MVYKIYLLICFALVALAFAPPEQSFSFVFKGRNYILLHPMRMGKTPFARRTGLNNKQLDTLSNQYDQTRHYVEIVRQDDAVSPHFGIAMGFEFNAEKNDYPYYSRYAVMQLKDFGWGGVEFSTTDTFNYTGVSDEVSDDLDVIVDSFSQGVIYAHFSGVLLNGPGDMVEINEGKIAVKLYRK
jgi:hypothetical protein